MKKLCLILTASVLCGGWSIAMAGGQADRYNEARSYPNKSVDETSSTPRNVKEQETIQKLKEEHRLLKELIADHLADR